MSYKLVKNLTKVNYTKGGKDKKYIVLHYTGNKTDTAKNNANYFRSEDRGASAHYFVDKNSVYQVVEDMDTAWAVGKNYGSHNLFGKCTNANSISVEMCSDGGKIADKTFQNAVELVKSLMGKHGIPASNVVRHWDVCSKACPGWNGWGVNGKDATIWKKFKTAIAGSVSGQSTPSKPASKPAAPAKKNNWVENLQKECNKQGFSNQTVDGIAGPKTLAGCPTLRKGAKGNITKLLQERLIDLGYSCGRSGADGDFGKDTYKAVCKYQKAHGLSVDGIVGHKTWKKLLGL